MVQANGNHQAFEAKYCIRLANAEAGVVVRKGHVCQLKGYHEDGSFQAHDK
jgi:hypothetical protein